MLKRSYVVVLAVLAVGLGLIVSGCTDTATENSIVSEDSVLPDEVQEDSSAIGDSPDDGITEVTEQDPLYAEEVNNTDDAIYVVASEEEVLTEENVSEEDALIIETGSEEDEITDLSESEDVEITGDEISEEEDISDVTASEEDELATV